MSRKPRVLVAMSGGVDSAVAAALLHRQGYDVIGVTLRLYTETDDGALRSKRACCGIEDVADARDAARRIGIPHYVLNMEREFERDVIDYFVDSYAAGRTPNPCLACNQYVKFSTLLDRATGWASTRSPPVTTRASLRIATSASACSRPSTTRKTSRTCSTRWGSASWREPSSRWGRCRSPRSAAWLASSGWRSPASPTPPTSASSHAATIGRC